MKKVITYGVFDFFHFGHLRLLKNIKTYFNEDIFLTVFVQDWDYILKYKPNTTILYSTQDRIEMIKELRCVDDAQVYKIVSEHIKTIDFDVWVKGPDQNHSGFKIAEQYCVSNNKEIVILPRTKLISSTYIKELLKSLKK